MPAIEGIKDLERELQELSVELSKNKMRMKFAEGWANGKSQAQAYKDAGYKSKKPAIDASKTVKRCPTIVRYREVYLEIARLRAEAKQIGTFDQKRKVLWESIQRCFSEVESANKNDDEEEENQLFKFDANAIARLTDVLNKMDGDYDGRGNKPSTIPVMPDSKEDRMNIYKEVLFREAFSVGEGASQAGRISAIEKLMKLENEGGPQVVNNVMVVPAVGSVDEWEARASQSQSELKKSVKD